MARQENASYEGSGSRQPIKIRELEESLKKAQETIIELQEKLLECWILGEGGIEIPEGADLDSDEYKVPGNYYCESNTAGATLTNSPTVNAFTMKVSYATGTGYPRQDVYIYNGGHHWTRTFGVDSAWTKWVRGYLSSEVDNLLNKKANIEKATIKNPTLHWYIGDRDALADYAQLRQAGANETTALSLVYYNAEAATTSFLNLIDKDGIFLPDYAYRTAASTSITTAATNAWTNMRSIVLSAGTWFVEAQVDITGAANAITGRLYAGSTEYGRQSVYCKDGNIYSARIGAMIKLSGSTTLYLQTWSPSSLTVNRTILTATRMR